LFDGLLEASDEDVDDQHEVVLVGFAAGQARAKFLVQEVANLGVHKRRPSYAFNQIQFKDLVFFFKCFKGLDYAGSDVGDAGV
jgi:hypothetical protein